MPDAPIRFVRLRLFFAYSLVAWYSLFKPERGLTMLKDFGEAEDKRKLNGVRERIFSQTKKATSKGELG